MKIKGKQILNATITQNNMGITTASVVSENCVTTKEYVELAIQSGVSNMVYSTHNVDMTPENTSGATPMLAITLASGGRIVDIPQGGVRVYVNGVEVNVGVGLDCFFAPEDSGTPTPREFGSEQQNDYLWWNPSVAPYQLESTDSITYTYLTYTPI